MITNTDTTAASGAASWDGKLPDSLQRSLNALRLECPPAVVNTLEHEVRSHYGALHTSLDTVKRMYGVARDRLEEIDAALPDPFAAPAAQEAEPAGYRISDPEEPEIGSWFSETPARAKYGLLSEPLYAHPPRPQADAGAQTAVKVTQDMRRVFREAYRVGGFWADRLDYALDRMLAAAPQAPAAGAAPTDADLPDVEDMAHSALQEALSFGLGHDVLHRWMRAVMDKTVTALGAAAPAQEAADAAQDFDEWFYRQRVSAESDVMPSDEKGMRSAWNAAIDAARARQEGQA